MQEAEAGQSLGIPGHSNDTREGTAGLSGDTANEKAESIGRRSKRSITGRRKRDASAASKEGGQQQPQPNEKEATSSGGTGPVSPLRPKKKSGFLSFLNCCATPDEGQEVGQQETAQPAKAPKSQPVRAQQPTQSRPPQTVSTTGTSAEDSKELIDEKPVQDGHQNATAAEPILLAPESEKPPQGDATVEQPVPSSATDVPPVQPNAEVRPLDAGSQTLVAEGPTMGPPHAETSAPAREAPSSSQSPQLQVQAPTPVVQQQEDEMILDRTPEQAQRDNDIEMSDSGPSLPLTGQDAAVVVEEEKQDYERRESSPTDREDLPPPPPRQEQHDGTAVSHDTSLVSTPEPSQKWLLPPLKSEMRGRKCLVLDLDETLVHSSFKVSF